MKELHQFYKWKMEKEVIFPSANTYHNLIMTSLIMANNDTEFTKGPRLRA